MTAVAGRLVTKNGPVIEKSIADLSTASSQLKELLDSNKGHLDAILSNGDTLTSYAVALMRRVEGLTNSIQGLMQDIESGKGALGMLIKDETFSKELKKTISDVDTLAKAVKEDALKLRVVKIKWFGEEKLKEK